MGDDEQLQSSKKRVAGRQLTKDNPELDDEKVTEEEMGTFKKASDEVLAARRIVKARRNTTAAAPSSTPASANPFAGIQFPVASTEAEVGKMAPEKVAEKVDTNLETDEEQKKSQSDAPGEKLEPIGEERQNLKQSIEAKSTNAETTEGNLTVGKGDKDSVAESREGEASKDAREVRDEAEADSSLEGNKNAKDSELKVEEKESNGSSRKNEEKSSFGSFQQLSSGQNAFPGFAGTGFSSSTFSFGSITKDGAGSRSLFGTKSDQTFGIGLSGNENTSLLGTAGSSSVNKSVGTGFPTKQEVSIETGEENEKAVFAADSVLFEFTDGCWKERGKGEL